MFISNNRFMLFKNLFQMGIVIKRSISETIAVIDHVQVIAPSKIFGKTCEYVI